MSFEVVKEDKYSVVKVKADKLDSSIAASLKAEFLMLNSDGSKNIILDLSETIYCDSSGLSAILIGNRLCRNLDGTFVVTGLQPTVSKLMAISQLDTVLNIVPTMNESVDLLFMEEIEKDLNKTDE
jgi:anti-sigma B factor antagonist